MTVLNSACGNQGCEFGAWQALMYYDGKPTCIEGQRPRFYGVDFQRNTENRSKSAFQRPVLPFSSKDRNPNGRSI